MRNARANEAGSSENDLGDVGDVDDRVRELVGSVHDQIVAIAASAPVALVVVQVSVERAYK